MKEAVAIITARGGSKRIPRKNIKLFHGLPIVAYSIKAALSSGIFDEVMVSTDDEEIASVAREYGAAVPFLRSSGASDDFATTADVLIEVLDMYKANNFQFNYSCCIYPTAPFVTSDKLKHAYAQLKVKHADVVFPIVRYSSSIWRSLAMQPDGKLKYIWPENALKRSQDLPDTYYDSGQFYFFSVPIFLKAKSLLTHNTLGIPVPEMEVQDIDNELDWRVAEYKFAYLKSKQDIF